VVKIITACSYSIIKYFRHNNNYAPQKTQNVNTFILLSIIKFKMHYKLLSFEIK
jgi:hypothetical protein